MYIVDDLEWYLLRVKVWELIKKMLYYRDVKQNINYIV